MMSLIKKYFLHYQKEQNENTAELKMQIKELSKS